MPDFRSILVLDLETTGLPWEENNKTRVTELALVSCEVDHLQENSDCLPRVVNKLVLCINPGRMINPIASDISGLDNDLLCTSGTFQKYVAEMVNSFIIHLPKPILMTAHNGIKFDFPIFKKELERHNVVLPDSLYCADSLTAFKEMFLKVPPVKKVEITLDDDDLLCIQAVDSLEDTGRITPDIKTKPSNTVLYKSKCLAKRQLSMEENEETPIKKILFQQNVVDSEKPSSYKLGDLYSFIVKKPFLNAHRAENDCLALLLMIIKKKTPFFNYAQENATLFSEIKALF